ncbi:hypothetical protein GGS23DRAFT_551064 [Durotheca rogersii]|uniref:uncharacterized protein n=1 Tax=Durotheca rogersii TaxID=419775 RepID=UPI00221F01DC|nr:uncharacterized protein GGS23DRAFT_551064 [Durotheca rogersii]KAI5866546.1 hypothetical protein GGS23DRAFT_551064 [Durotheca rogersii]
MSSSKNGTSNYSSSSFVSVSFSQTTRNGQTTGARYASHTASDPQGTTTFTGSQRLGEPVYTERRDYDASGRLIYSDRGTGAGGGVDSSRRIEEASDGDERRRQRENDRLYEERIEDEYAKREGGA